MTATGTQYARAHNTLFKHFFYSVQPEKKNLQASDDMRCPQMYLSAVTQPRSVDLHQSARKKNWTDTAFSEQNADFVQRATHNLEHVEVYIRVKKSLVQVVQLLLHD